MKLNLGGIIPLSSNEWKEHISTVIFFNGCPFRCSYCHNHQMIFAKNYVNTKIVKNSIKNSLPFINSVVFSGGEPTEQPEPLEDLLNYSKQLNLKTMIETNGYHPEILKDLIRKNLIDEVYIDIKTTKEEYLKLTGKDNAYEKMIESINVSVPVVKRTTIFKNFSIPKCSNILQRGLVKLSPDKTLDEYTLEEFERLIYIR